MKGVRQIFLLLLLLLPVLTPLPFQQLQQSAFSITAAKNNLKHLGSQINNQDSVGLSTLQGYKYPHIDSRILAANGNPPRDWTILMYMCADNDLDTTAVSQIVELEKVGSTQQVNILVFVDFASTTSIPGPDAYTYNITQAPLNTTIISEPLTTNLPTEPNMGDPSTLVEFIRFGQNYSEAEHYLLVIWDHGSGYVGVCYDETSGNDRLVPHEIALALENSTIDPIDIVAFDASFMGQLELTYEIQHGADLLVFSENHIPQHGFPYNLILHNLNLVPSSSPFALAKEIVDRYIPAYSPGGTYATFYPEGVSDLCLSVINTSKINEVVHWLNETIEILLEPQILPGQYTMISGARGNSQQFIIPNFIDLWSFAHQLALHTTNITIQALAVNTSLSVLAAIPYERRMSAVPGAIGLAINFADYEAIPLSFLNVTRYSEFITAFQQIGETRLNSVVQLYPSPLNGYLDGENDSVYFLVTVEVSAEYTIILAPFADYDADFDLYLLDARGNLLTRSVLLTSTEVIQYALVPGQSYYIQVFSHPRADITFGLGVINLQIIPGPIINPIIIVMIGCLIIGIVILIILGSFFFYHYWKRQVILRQITQTRELAETGSGSTTEQPTGEVACVECGEILPRDAKFCPKCGITFEESKRKDTSKTKHLTDFMS